MANILMAVQQYPEQITYLKQAVVNLQGVSYDHIHGSKCFILLVRCFWTMYPSPEFRKGMHILCASSCITLFNGNSAAKPALLLNTTFKMPYAFITIIFICMMCACACIVIDVGLCVHVYVQHCMVYFTITTIIFVWCAVVCCSSILY